MIRPVQDSDVERLCDIYNFYVKNTTITFEEVPVHPAEMLERIRKITPYFPWLVYEEEGRPLGYAYAAEWKQRSAYRFSAESTVYVENDARRKGVGSALLARLIEELKKIGVHTVIGGVALPNEASRRLHEKMGFQKAAHLAEVGNKFGGWIDVEYWQLVLRD